MSIGLGLFALITAASAQPPDTRPSRPCTADRAEAARIADIQNDYPSWRYRCVRLRGLAFRDRLYADRPALLEARAIYGDGTTNSLVIYGGSGHRRSDPPRMVEIVGTIFSCADHHAVVEAMQEPDTITIVGGYCHTSLANYVQPVTVRQLNPSRVLRLTEADIPPERRPLVEAPENIPGRASHIEAARAMVAATASNNEAEYFRLSHPSAFHALRGGEAATAGWAVQERDAARAALRVDRDQLPPGLPPPDRLQERVFVERNELTPGEDREIRPSVYLVCWCKGSDCTGKWPILTFDADNAPERPYFCVRTSPYLIDRFTGTAIQADLSRLWPGFAEPDWTTAQ